MEPEMIRKLLLTVSLQTGGDFDKIIEVMHNRDYPSMEDILNAEKRIKSNYITLIDKEYPPQLKKVYKPPIVLFYYGDISLLYKEKEAIAVIGSREASTYGVAITHQLVSDLSPDYVIVSGMARGIDSVAHETALMNNGKTIAVLGSGIDYCYPPSNRDLYLNIKEKGLVISEYPNATFPEPENFPKRNRIIAGLAKGVLITEAHKRSGTLITVNWAESFSKEIMCVPHRPEDDSGCNQLIKDGAFMVEDGDDVRLVMDGTRNLKKTLM